MERTAPDPPPELPFPGTLRAALNKANAAVAKIGADGRIEGPAGIILELLRERIAGKVELCWFDSAAEIMAACGEWDLAFIAYDLSRLDRLLFSSPILTLKATLLVNEGAADLLDVPGRRIASATGTAFDLRLREAVPHSVIVPFATPDASLQAFEEGKVDTVAGIRSWLEARRNRWGNGRLLADNFALLEQAIAVPIGQQFLRDLLDDILAARTVGKEPLPRDNQISGELR